MSRALLGGVLLGLLAAPLPAGPGLAALRRQVREAGEAYRAGDYEAAARGWRGVAAQHPRAELWYRAALAFARAGRPLQARACVEEALALEPGHAKALRVRDSLMQAPPPRGPPPPARSMPGGPEDPEDPGEEDELDEDDDLDGDGDFEDPPDPRDQLRALAVRPAPELAEQAWIDARRLRRLGEHRKAIAKLLRAYGHGYTRVEVDAALGRLLLEDEQVEAALFHLERAWEAVGEDQGVLLHLGKAYGLAGRFEEQVESLEEAVEIDPGFGEAHLHLALAYDRIRASEKVLEHAQKAIRAAPEYREKLVGSLRDSAVLRRLEATLQGVLRAPAPPPLAPGDIDVYATQLAGLLYPETFQGSHVGVQGQGTPASGGPAVGLAGPEDFPFDRPDALPLDGPGDLPPATRMGEAGPMGRGLEAPLPPPSGPRPTAAQLAAVLRGLAAGEGRRAFEALPHALRAEALERLADELRENETFAPLRGPFEAAMRE